MRVVGVSATLARPPSRLARRTARPSERSSSSLPLRGGDYSLCMGEVLPFRREPAIAQREPLWREALGGQLRQERAERGERLVDVAGRAGVSAQYLSELERGLKEPSSEVLAAVAGALHLTVADLTTRASGRLARPGFSGPVCLAA